MLQDIFKQFMTLRVRRNYPTRSAQASEYYHDRTFYSLQIPSLRIHNAFSFFYRSPVSLLQMLLHPFIVGAYFYST